MPRSTVGIIVILMLGILTVPPAADAQRSGMSPHVGFLTPSRCPTDPAAAERPGAGAFLEGLRERGYVVGKTLIMTCRVSDGTADQVRALAVELVHLKVDMIFAVSSAAVRAAKSATDLIPIVAVDLETDPVVSGVAASLARPGGNITGVFLDLPELNGKRLELLKEALPSLSRVSVLWDDSMDPTPLRAAEGAARAVGVQLHIARVQGPDDFDAAFGLAIRERSEAVMVIQSPLTTMYAKRIVDLAVENRLPTIGMFPEFVKDGGLMSYGPNIAHLFRRTATFVDKIVKGAKPGDIPIERPMRFYLGINLKTAKALGLTLPPTLLFQADEVIQ